jgi:hypothetical protein
MIKYLSFLLLFLNCFYINSSSTLLYSASYNENVLVIFRENNGFQKSLCCQKIFKDKKNGNYRCVSASVDTIILYKDFVNFIEILKSNCN